MKDLILTQNIYDNKWSLREAVLLEKLVLVCGTQRWASKEYAKH